MRMFMQLFIAAQIAIITGCASVGVTRVNTAPAKPPGCDLDIYTEKSEIERPYEVVCLLDSVTGTAIFDDRTGAGAIEVAKPKACECGADGILIEVLGSEAPTFNSQWGRGKAVVKAIRYLD